jgi:2,3-bisphosphoglycerate-dependent phosphoglycerate mutase
MRVENHESAHRRYLVRHAEKDLTDPSAKNPPLTPAGVQRANHLAEKLQQQPIEAIFSTEFERNVNTVKPLAEKRGVQIQTYEWHDYPGIQSLIEKEKGKTLLVCGHGDNLLPIIKNLGAKPPLDSIPAYEYDNLFKVVLQPDGKASVEVEKFR